MTSDFELLALRHGLHTRTEQAIRDAQKAGHREDREAAARAILRQRGTYRGLTGDDASRLNDLVAAACQRATIDDSHHWKEVQE